MDSVKIFVEDANGAEFRHQQRHNYAFVSDFTALDYYAEDLVFKNIEDLMEEFKSRHFRNKYVYNHRVCMFTYIYKVNLYYVDIVDFSTAIGQLKANHYRHHDFNVKNHITHKPYKGSLHDRAVVWCPLWLFDDNERDMLEKGTEMYLNIVAMRVLDTIRESWEEEKTNRIMSSLKTLR